jgi:hypothetical protein
VAATHEVMSLGFYLNPRGLEEFLPDVQERLQTRVARHNDLPRPANAGRAIGQPRQRKP